MQQDFILASGSEIRAQLLKNAGLDFSVKVAAFDEGFVRAGLEQKGASAFDIADALAEGKAREVARSHHQALVLGCDQVAALGRAILTKPADPDHAHAQLSQLSGKTHHLYTAAVLFAGGVPVWRQVGVVNLRMHRLSDSYIRSYVARNWHSIRHSVGCYKLEEEGVRLFSAVEGDYFHVLGLPLIELLSYLTERGDLEI